MDLDTLVQNIAVVKGVPEQNSTTDMWIYIAVIEFAIILFLCACLFLKGKKTSKQLLKEKVLAENEVDFSNVINSSFHAKSLYDELKGKCHPDKYKDEAMNAEATEIFQLLVKHKYDYKVLLQLKERAEKNLGI